MAGLLQRVRAFDRRHPLWWDVTVAVALAAISISTTPQVDLAGVVLLILAGVVLRRRKPFAALLIVLAGAVWGAVISGLTDVGVAWMYMAVWIVLFNVGLRKGGRHIGAVGAMIAVVGLAAFVAPVDAMPVELLDRILSSLTVTAVSSASYLVGLQINNRRQALIAHRQEAAREAVITERSRIAHEMHDIIGHNLSVITSLANGGTVAVKNSPPDAERAFYTIGEISRSSVREVRRVLAVLRYDQSPDGASLTPQPGLADIAALVDTVRAAGVRVVLERSGDLEGILPGRQLVAYRIVQESLTNVLRHTGPQTDVTIRIAFEDASLVVLVDDNGIGSMSMQGAAPAEPGHGILGMRERAEAYGGTVEAYPTRVGWRVLAQIPDDRNHEP
ncbi:sensor histidine kinase [Brevibacterium sp. FAM 25378]|uniref:sensor histidine kinase n=1 Tax=unclassified Brevibacterium TaxID=2614124 RepID=UPI00143DE810|nr:histidine kinase [Brevibacterium sp. S22]